jgi:hypothetical protein
MMNLDPETFSLPSTAGDGVMRFHLVEVEDPGGFVALYATVEATVRGRLSAPMTLTTALPAVRTSRDELESLLRLVQGYARRMGSREAQGEGAGFAFIQEHRLALRFEPRAEVAAWRAWCSFSLSAGPGWSLAGGYEVDATCLDVFGDGLARALRWGLRDPA